MHKTQKAIAAVGTFMVVMATTAATAMAQYVDPTGGAAGDVGDGAEGWITNQGIPLIVGLLVIGIVVGLLVKFSRRGARAA